jgi:thymidine phosphorylase
MTEHITRRVKDELTNAAPGDEIFVDDKAALTVKSNNEQIVAGRNGYDYVVEVDGRDVSVVLMDTGRVEESKEIETNGVSVLQN